MPSPKVDLSVRTRADAQRTVAALIEPVLSHFSAGNARVRLGETGAIYPDVDAELEGFSRPLWGIAPLVAGGGTFEHWERYRRGLVHGCDPDHEEYWGHPDDHSQKHVEMAAIGVALALTPEHLWEPLSPEDRRLVETWLGRTNEATLPDANWRFFRVLTNLGLRRVGAEHDWERVRADLERLDGYALADGWYSDGTDDGLGPRDHYVAWEMHVDGLLYATLVGEGDPGFADRFRERAADFAAQYVHWFDEAGRALPYGRSLTYRFAQAAFWGALAVADVKPPTHSWAAIRGLWARNLQWWLDQPIFTDGGLLSIGYRYPNTTIGEIYNAPAGPYWALKAALPLALPDTHPFWEASPEPLPDLPSVTVQEEPGLVICRDAETGHHFALAAGQDHVAGSISAERAKYNGFTYSSAFGFSVPTRRPGLSGAGHDGSLVLGEDDRGYLMRQTVEEHTVGDGVAHSRWGPFDDVTVETWLVPVPPWHVRVHRLESGRRLKSAEGGFPLDRTGDHEGRYETQTSGDGALARFPAGTSGIRDLLGTREGSVVAQDPNANLCAPRTVVPTLTGEHDTGRSWLAAAVVASPAPDPVVPWSTYPEVSLSGDAFTVMDAGGTVVFEREP